VKRRLGAAAVAAGTMLATGSALAAPVHHAQQTVTPVKITVSMGEFYFKLSRPSVRKTSAPLVVWFTVVNRGAIAHDFVLKSLRKGSRLLQPGGRQVLKITFRRKGRYPYLCNVPRHAEQGMAGTFVVR
jgi:uncharacterized cupredoxin-like copper-binding protein